VLIALILQAQEKKGQTDESEDAEIEGWKNLKADC
jgi:hypothetical protein